VKNFFAESVRGAIGANDDDDAAAVAPAANDGATALDSNRSFVDDPGVSLYWANSSRARARGRGAGGAS
jgi:hypothetical protein